MAIGKITRDDRLISVTSTEGDVFLFQIMEDCGLEQGGAAAWAQDRRPSKTAGKARALEARMAAADWLAKGGQVAG